MGSRIVEFGRKVTLLRSKPRSLRPWMNAEGVPFEALKERSRVCFGGFRPLKHVEELRALARGAPLIVLLKGLFGKQIEVTNENS
jgi:hypothetical protein